MGVKWSQFTDITADLVSRTLDRFMMLSEGGTDGPENVGISPEELGKLLGWRLAGTPSTGGGGDGIWNHSGNVANVDFTGLGAFSEVLILINDVTLSVSSGRDVRVGHGAGPTYLTSAGDYNVINTSGVEGNNSEMGTHNTASASARSSALLIRGFNLTAPKVADQILLSQAAIISTTNPLTAVRIFSSGGGNLTGGSIRVYAR